MVRNWIDEINFCKYSMSIGGVLENQVDTYIGSRFEINNKVGYAANAMVDELGLNSNITISTPIMSQIEDLVVVRVFFTAMMVVVILFLCILST